MGGVIGVRTNFPPEYPRTNREGEFNEAPEPCDAEVPILAVENESWFLRRRRGVVLFEAIAWLVVRSKTSRLKRRSDKREI